MAVNVGFDLVATDEINESLASHGDRYLRRIYTDVELAQSGAQPRLLAERFAAKEATMKALRRRDEAIPWNSIGVRTDGNGELALELSGEAAALARARDIRDLTISVTNRRNVSAAIVLARTGNAR
jgi:holo-[acyl-carrier protein] synthase